APDPAAVGRSAPRGRRAARSRESWIRLVDAPDRRTRRHAPHSRARRAPERRGSVGLLDRTRWTPFRSRRAAGTTVPGNPTHESDPVGVARFPRGAALLEAAALFSRSTAPG